MIDLHTHIVPGLDDGAVTLDDALHMARLAVADGVTTLAATPHADAENRQPGLGEGLEVLLAALERDAVPLRIVAGAEIRLSPEVPDLLASGALRTLAGTRYALVELPFHVAPPNLPQRFYDLQMARITPVVAHVERYRFVQAAPEMLEDWTDRGAILQVTGGSLAGEFGGSARRIAEMVVRRPWAAILASDAHDARARAPRLAAARQAAASLAGEARAVDLVELGPAAILGDRPFPAPRAPELETREGGLGRRLFDWLRRDR